MRQRFRAILFSACFTACSLPAWTGVSVFGQEAQEPVVTAQPLVAPAAEDFKVANDLNHNQWIRLDADGSFWGSISTPAGENQIRQHGVEVSLVQHGERIATANSAEDGSFRFSNQRPGIYSLVARTPSTLAIMSLTILDPVSGRHLPNGIQVRTLTPATERVVSLVKTNTLPHSAIDDRSAKDPIAEERKFLNSPRIAIDKDGGIRGRLSIPAGKIDLSKTQVFLTHSGNEVARSFADRDGNYRFDNVPPGNYGFVASGPEGIAALGFVAVGENKPDRLNTGLANDGTKFVNAFLQDDAVPALNVEMASPDCLGSQATVTDEAALGSCCPLPMGGCCGVAGGGYGGGGGGGGIGGSFGGGLLPLGIVGGLTAVGIAAANKKKTEVIVSPVVK